VCAVGEVLVCEGTWVGVACCRYWPEAGHMLAQLCDVVRDGFGCDVQNGDGFWPSCETVYCSETVCETS
jgi:hypothetical protein